MCPSKQARLVLPHPGGLPNLWTPCSHNRVWTGSQKGAQQGKVLDDVQQTTQDWGYGAFEARGFPGSSPTLWADCDDPHIPSPARWTSQGRGMAWPRCTDIVAVIDPWGSFFLSPRQELPQTITPLHPGASPVGYQRLGLDTLAVHWCLPDPSRAWHWSCTFRTFAWQRADQTGLQVGNVVVSWLSVDP